MFSESNFCNLARKSLTTFFLKNVILSAYFYQIFFGNGGQNLEIRTFCVKLQKCYHDFTSVKF